MAISWTEIQQSQLFTWFNCSETGRSPAADGGAVVRLKSGAYQDDIDITLEIDAQQRLRRATLTIDRAWAEGARTRAFADDLVKSFLLVLSPEGSVGRSLATQIESLLGSNPGVIRRVDASVNQTPSTPDEPLQAALDTYAGRSQRAALSDAPVRVLLENGDFGGKDRLGIELRLAETGKPAGAGTPTGFFRRLFGRLFRKPAV